MSRDCGGGGNNNECQKSFQNPCFAPVGCADLNCKFGDRAYTPNFGRPGGPCCNNNNNNRGGGCCGNSNNNNNSGDCCRNNNNNNCCGSSGSCGNGNRDCGNNGGYNNNNNNCNNNNYNGQSNCNNNNEGNCCNERSTNNSNNCGSGNNNNNWGCNDYNNGGGNNNNWSPNNGASDFGGCGQDSMCCPLGCRDIGCGCPTNCPPRPPPTKRQCSIPCPPLPCCGGCTDQRAHHLNRSPYCCPCRPCPDPCVYRCCEGMCTSYAGHVPGFTYHSLARTYPKATFGTKNYMQSCLYYNTWSKI